eukprot:g42723.t1
MISKKTAHIDTDITIQQYTARQTRQQTYTTSKHTKNRKLERLGITTSNIQASPGTIVEGGTTTGKSIVNFDRYAQAIRECINARFISHTHKVVQNIIQAQHNAIRALKTNCNIVIKPADKGGAIVIQNRTDYCGEEQQQLNNQEHYRRLPSDPTKDHTRQLNRLVNTFDAVLQSTLCTLIPRTSCVGNFYCLPKIHKANTPGRPIVSVNGTLCENLSGYVKGILKPT